jgi:hypothetical protein
VTGELVLDRVASFLHCDRTALPEASEILVSSVGRCDGGVWFSPTMYFHRQRARAYLQGNQLEMEVI